jgi:hypothetical protein
MAAQRCETLSGFHRDVVAVTQGSRSAALRGNPWLSYASPLGYFTYRNFLRAYTQKVDGLFSGRRHVGPSSAVNAGLVKGYARYVYSAISAFSPARLVAGIRGSVDIEDVTSILKPNGIIPIAV